MFVGHYKHKLNSRGQLAVPAKMRLGIPADEEDNKSLYLMKLDEAPIYALTAPVLDDLASRIEDKMKQIDQLLASVIAGRDILLEEVASLRQIVLRICEKP